MSKKEHISSEKKNPPSVEEIKQNIRDNVENIINFCTKEQDGANFFSIEKELQSHISQLACLFFQLYLMFFQEQLDYSKWLESGLYYIGRLVPRNIKTIYGKVRYWRIYLIRKGNDGNSGDTLLNY